MTSEIIYKGELRTTCTHLKSGQEIITDAPTDNQGKGEAFSPTDLLATSLGSCILTIMGIAANTHSINLLDTKIQITKFMGENPRRVVKIKADVYFKAGANLSEKEKTILQQAAKNCPVAKSLHPDIEQDLSFNYPD